MKRVAIRITNNSGAEVLHGEFDLPAVLGRGSEATVRFDQERTVVSRLHAEIRATDSGLVVRHLGEQTITIVDGVKLEAPGLEAPLASTGGTIVMADQIARVGGDAPAQPAKPNHEVHLGAASRVVSAIVSGEGVRHDQIFVLDSTGIEIHCDPNTGSAFVIEAEHDDTGEKTKLSPANQETSRIATIAFGARGGSVEVAPGIDPGRVIVNALQLNSPRMEITLFDIVEVGRVKIEIAGSEPVVLRCVNDACERVNPYRPGENCKFCGYRLVESQSVYLPGLKL